MLRLDLHLHTSASFDCQVEPERVLRRCHRLGLMPIAITDHDTIAAAAAVAGSAPRKAIVGQEITTASGDMIGLFMREPVEKGLSARETALRIKDQNGLVYLPHPYDRFRRHCSDEILEDLAELIDIVEVFNGRSEETANRRAADLCEILRAAPGAGSDAHTLPELGGVYVEIDEFDGPREFVRRLRSARIVRRPNRWRMRLDAPRRPRFG